MHTADELLRALLVLNIAVIAVKAGMWALNKWLDYYRERQH
jgi:formate hydrogenlyase subunit 3/multisubunit Na+/H+ antiporter MnhD subunit